MCITKKLWGIFSIVLILVSVGIGNIFYQLPHFTQSKKINTIISSENQEDLSNSFTNTTDFIYNSHKLLSANNNFNGYIGNFSLVHTARSTHLDNDLGLIGVGNKNGFVDVEEMIVYKLGNYTSPFKSQYLEYGDMALDYAWNYPYLAISSCDAEHALQIYDISDLEGTWPMLASFDTGTKSHVCEWTLDGNFLITEYLDEQVDPDFSTIAVINATSSEISTWNYTKIFSERFGTDIFQMEVSQNYLTFQSNQEFYTNYAVHIWDISDLDPTNWIQLYELKNNLGGDISPDEKYIITTDMSNRVFLRDSRNGSIICWNYSTGTNFQFTQNSQEMSGVVYGINHNIIHKIILNNFTEYAVKTPLDDGFQISIAHDNVTLFLAEGTVVENDKTVGVFDSTLLNFLPYEDLRPYANFTVNATTILEGESVEFNFTGKFGDFPNTLNWFFNDSLISSSSSNLIHRFYSEGEYNVCLNLYDKDGECSNSSKIINVINNPPIANFSISPNIIYVYQNIKFNFTGYIGNKPTQFKWVFGDESSDSSVVNPIHQFNESGIYMVSLTLLDSDGDSDTITKQISVLLPGVSSYPSIILVFVIFSYSLYYKFLKNKSIRTTTKDT